MGGLWVPFLLCAQAAGMFGTTCSNNTSGASERLRACNAADGNELPTGDTLASLDGQHLFNGGAVVLSRLPPSLVADKLAVYAATK